MKTRNLTKTTLSLAAAAFLAATNASFGSTVTLGTLTPFTGGDVGEGLDLSGNIIHAFNLGGTAQTVQGVNFAASTVGAPPAGITPAVGTLEFDYAAINPGNATDYGATPSDNALEILGSSVWYNANWAFDLAVVAGNQYQLQLIFQEGYFAFHGDPSRNFDVSVETASPDTLSLAVDDFAQGLETDGAAPAQPGADFGLVYTYAFTANDSSFRVGLDDSPAGSDGNAVLAAVTLKQVPEPSTFALFGLGFLGLFLRRSR